MHMKDLGNHGISNELIAIWQKEIGKQLLPIQEKAVSKGVLQGQNMLVVAPTSSGKTFIGEIAVVRAARKQKRAFYLVPFKAIAEEKLVDFRLSRR